MAERLARAWPKKIDPWRQAELVHGESADLVQVKATVKIPGSKQRRRASLHPPPIPTFTLLISLPLSNSLLHSTRVDRTKFDSSGISSPENRPK